MKTTKLSRVLLLLVALLPLALLTSCAHTQRYAEPNLPPNELATLEWSAPVWIVSLDGQSVSSSVFSDLTRVRIVPGAHRVELSYRRTDNRVAPAPRLNGDVYNAGEISSSIHDNARVTTYSLQNVTLNFVAKPRFAYSVKDGLSEKSWNPTIVESPRQ
jgi:hypothetical protein